MLILIAGLLAAAPAGSGDVAAVQQLESRFAERANAGDAAAIAALYAADGVVLPPKLEPQQGHDAIQAFWTQAVASLTHVRLTTVSATRLAPDVIQEVGRYSMQAKGDASQTLQGQYLVTWRKGADGWRITGDIWN